MKKNFIIMIDSCKKSIVRKNVIGRPERRVYVQMYCDGNVKVRNSRNNKDITYKYHVEDVFDFY